MRFAVLLAAMAALWVHPAQAVQVMYGMVLTGTPTPTGSRDFYPFDPPPFAGSFTFDTDLNRVSTFDLRYFSGPREDLVPGVNAILAGNPGCDLTCFIGALDGASWGMASTMGTFATVSLNFGGALNQTVSVEQYTGVFPSPAFGFEVTDGLVDVRGPIPEPSTWALILLGFGAIGWAMRRGGHVALTPKLSMNRA